MSSATVFFALLRDFFLGTVSLGASLGENAGTEDSDGTMCGICIAASILTLLATIRVAMNFRALTNK